MFNPKPPSVKQSITKFSDIFNIIKSGYCFWLAINLFLERIIEMSF